jgi:ubiquinone/menaquinone biosynthesis C-methylase UbiE
MQDTQAEQAEQVRRAWYESARFWSKHAAALRRQFAPLTPALLDGVGVGEGARVVDVAGGMGEPSLEIARRAGPSGLVVCTDFAEPMVDAARAEARVRGLTTMRFARCSAIALPFAAASFDAAVSRLGVMFFPDAHAGVAEMLRVVRPGGALGFVVWGDRGHNPYFTIPSEIFGRYVPSPPDPPDALTAWRFAEPGVLASILSAAGAIRVVERVVDFTIEAPRAFDEYWEMRIETSDTLREKAKQLEPEQLERAREELREATECFVGDATRRFPARAVVVSGFARE